MATEDRSYCPRFTSGGNFSIWKAKIEAYLVSKNQAEVLTELAPRNTLGAGDAAIQARAEQKYSSFLAADKTVRALLLLALDDKWAGQVLRCATAKDMWEMLISIHDKKSQSNKINLANEFFELRMKSGEPVLEYIRRAEDLYNMLKDIGMSCIDESILVIKIVCGLSREYVNFMSTWNNLDQSKHTLMELHARLRAEESLFQRFNSDHVEALTASTKRMTKEEIERKKTETKCFKCGKKGHWKRECVEEEEEFHARGYKTSTAV